MYGQTISNARGWHIVVHRFRWALFSLDTFSGFEKPEIFLFFVRLLSTSFIARVKPCEFSPLINKNRDVKQAQTKKYMVRLISVFGAGSTPALVQFK